MAVRNSWLIFIGFTKFHIVLPAEVTWLSSIQFSKSRPFYGWNLCSVNSIEIGRFPFPLAALFIQDILFPAGTADRPFFRVKGRITGVVLFHWILIPFREEVFIVIIIICVILSLHCFTYTGSWFNEGDYSFIGTGCCFSWFVYLFIWCYHLN